MPKPRLSWAGLAVVVVMVAILPCRAATPATLTPTQTAACKQLGLDARQIVGLIDKPLYKFTESEVDAYLKFLSATEPDLRKRILHLARKNIGQPYELYLLGEMPFEPYDPQPIYCLGKSDCLVFTEHTYAMALSHNWPSFMMLLQRIRYRDGHLGVATRNHYTEADWNISNSWLVEDLTAELAGDTAVKFSETIDRSKFLKNRYGLTVSIPIEKHEDVYLPYEQIERARSRLQDGDFVNVVRATVKKDAPPNEIFGGSAFVGHVGLIGHGPNGEVHMIHSSEPRVREEPIDAYIARSTKDNAAKDAAGKPRLVGFKFLRLRDDPLKNLRSIDGPDAPHVTLPSGDEAKL
jgi:N-acetylmuramoyl-L-alanine amidase-like